MVLYPSTPQTAIYMLFQNECLLFICNTLKLTVIKHIYNSYSVFPTVRRKTIRRLHIMPLIISFNKGTTVVYLEKEHVGQEAYENHGNPQKQGLQRTSRAQLAAQWHFKIVSVRAGIPGLIQSSIFQLHGIFA